MASLEERQALRYLVLQALYDRSDGDPDVHIPHEGLGADFGIDDKTVDRAIDYLVREGLGPVRQGCEKAA